MCVDECVVLFYIFEAVLVLGFVLYCINVVGGWVLLWGVVLCCGGPCVFGISDLFDKLCEFL